MPEKQTTKIQQIKFSTIYSSRGQPTTKCTIITPNGKKYKASCPSGASTGSKEAIALNDGKLLQDSAVHDNEIIKKYQNKDVRLVIENAMKNFIPHILSETCHNIFEFDQLVRKIDGTENFRNFGANISLPLSICFARMCAEEKKLSLHRYISNIYDQIDKSDRYRYLKGVITPQIPTQIDKNRFPSPNFNILNGGAHSGNEMPFQEIMINFLGSYAECLRKAAIFYNHIKSVISQTYGSIYTGYGDEGGYMPPIKTLDEAINLIRLTNAGLGFKDLRICVDSAANEFFSDGKYNINIQDEHTKEIRAVSFSGPQMVQFYLSILEKYDEIFLLEDPFAENDYESWIDLTAAISKKTNLNGKLILGDDSVVTNPTLIKNAILEKWCNSVLIKPNQIGNITDTLIAIRIAHENGFKCMISHRSGETEDDFIADLAVGTYADFIKAGSPRGERLLKYNKILEIYNEEEDQEE